ncbi:MAG: VPS10 domain-containing protein, partial [Acidobacteriota bacterium]
SGGLWKTVNGGITWQPIFERQGTISLGDLAIDPRNPEVIWAGTGEGNPRNSVSFGDGVYRSNDGGQTWQHLGLKDTRHISRILIHPHNSDIVFVGALGHAFGPNEERGVFVTYDGGKSWQRTLYLDAEHGIADMDIDPVNPNIVYAATWRFERKPWNFVSGSEKSGLYKSIDAGRTWKRLTNGLPKLVGRIGVKVAPSRSNIVYVISESNEGTLFRSEDHGETFRLMSKQPEIVSRGFYYTDLRVDPVNENRIYSISSPLFVSIDGGRTHQTIAPRIHIDYHTMWIDPLNPERIWAGNDGGVAVSYDKGESWENINNLPIGQPYHVFADQSLPFYQIMGGMQDNGSWTGPSRTREPAGILNDDWRMVSFGDGFKVINHPDNPDLYLSLSQGGNVVLTDMRTREQQFVKPWVGGSGGAAANQKYRFHWNSPLVFSPHDRTTVYLAGNVLFKSSDFGQHWVRISPDLTTNDPAKLKEAGGPIATENTTAEYHCTIISVNESPKRPGTIWAGTDDGNLQLTINGGQSWTNLTARIAGLPPNSSVSHIEPSQTSADTAYVSFDRHMVDDYKPYVFKTVDGGKSFVNITGNLPLNAYVHFLKEDPRQPGLLYAGTELGLFATYDQGRTWIELGLKNLPRVAIHDIVVHPRENDLILATHGRSFWIFDDATVIQQTTGELLKKRSHLFEPRPAMRFTTRFTRYGIGDKPFAGPNPPAGALLTYYLKEKPEQKTRVMVQILDEAGKVVREISSIPREAGFNRTTWDLGEEGPTSRRNRTDTERGGSDGGG